jgi:thioesterase domain-containing protein
MEAMAADYLDQMRAVQPRGAYHLVGWSFGGEVAHAVATTIQQQGGEVRLLGLLDSDPGGGGDEAVREVELPVPDRPEHSIIRPLLEAMGEPLAIRRHAFLVGKNAERLAAAYVRPTFHGDALLFASTMPSHELSAADPEALATLWRPFIAGRIELHRVNGTHGDLLLKAKLAAQIAHILTRTLASRRQGSLAAGVF